MEEKQVTPIEQLAFKLLYCKGIGLNGRWKIIHYAEKYSQKVFSVEELLRIAEIHSRAQLFRQSFLAITDEWLADQWNSQQFISWRSERYPREFHHFPDPPIFLFYVGDISLLRAKKIAFVGARDASDYALQVVRKFVPRLIARNYVTVSGLARGVDQQTHEVSIRCGGRTIGVIGCGVDTCYPKEVSALFVEMRKNHLILSEYPKGTPVLKHHFPMRNRIIAAISQGVCVVEAKEKSGSLITAQLALEYGKEVFAIPGEVLTGRSDGCHRLIQDGAKCVYTSSDISEELPEWN